MKVQKNLQIWIMCKKNDKAKGRNRSHDCLKRVENQDRRCQEWHRKARTRKRRFHEKIKWNIPKELEDEETKFLSLDNVDQKIPVTKEEEWKEDIEKI